MNTAPAYFYRIEKMRELSPAQVGTVPCFHKEVSVMLKTRKVVIVGAGHVGSHVALALIQSGEADDIVLIDILKEKAAAQALDLDDCVSGALCGQDRKSVV